MNNLTPIELQKWCESHPEYASFKKEAHERRSKFCIEHNITEEMLNSFTFETII
jgi:hypothetical protein